jgi:hypothetical protein
MVSSDTVTGVLEFLASYRRVFEVYVYQGFYSLLRSDEGYGIASLCHNQIPRLLACAGRPSISIS